MGAAASHHLKLVFSPRALREAERSVRWWREHRPAAPKLFEEELRAALDQIRAAPQLGVAYQAMPGREHRRLLMPPTRYHVYYRSVVPHAVRILAVWSAVRGRGPRP